MANGFTPIGLPGETPCKEVPKVLGNKSELTEKDLTQQDKSKLIDDIDPEQVAEFIIINMSQPDELIS